MATTRTDSVRPGDVSGSRWWLGWHPIVASAIGGGAGLAVGNAMAIPVEVTLGVHPLVAMGGLTVAGFLAGLVGWYLGTKEINRRYRTVLDGFRSGTVAPGADATTYALVAAGEGWRPLVTPHRRYEATYVRLGESGIGIYPGVIDLTERKPELDGDAVEIRYDDVASVAYDGTALVVSTTDGEAFRYEADADPTELLRALPTPLGRTG